MAESETGVGLPVHEVGADGSVTVVDDERGRVTLPSSYAATSLTLSYGSTTRFRS